MVVRPTFNALSLCAGIGGIDLGLRAVCPSVRSIAYVEREAFSAAVLAARMEEGKLDPAPIWSELATFDAQAWRGVVDLVTAGFPLPALEFLRKTTKDRRQTVALAAYCPDPSRRATQTSRLLGKRAGLGKWRHPPRSLGLGQRGVRC